MPSISRQDEPGIYRIRVWGHLDEGWSEWLGGLRIEPQARGDTLLTGVIRDQASLHGLLIKIRDLGLPLLCVVRKRGGSERSRSGRARDDGDERARL